MFLRLKSQYHISQVVIKANDNKMWWSHYIVGNINSYLHSLREIITFLKIWSWQVLIPQSLDSRSNGFSDRFPE